MTEFEALPAAYRHIDPAQRDIRCSELPRNVFIEVTNRCNLECVTCPRTYASFEPQRDLSLVKVLAIADQFPMLERAVLHGIGEPLLNVGLPEMVEELKKRGAYVLFNSNGTALTAELASALVSSGLDEFRLSLDAAEPDLYERLRGRPLFGRVVANLRMLTAACQRVGAGAPRVSLWTMALHENVDQLPALLHLARDTGVAEVYLQRLTYGVAPQERYGLARPSETLYGRIDAREAEIVATCEDLAAELGLAFRASGATNPLGSLKARKADAQPWSDCLRPWATAYITANGNALPCCIAPFATTRYRELILGNVWEQSFSRIWNDEPYRAWRAALLSVSPHQACLGCGVYWSL